MGLAISKRLIEAMGGEHGLDSQPGTGSRLWFTVQLGKRPVGGQPASATAGESAKDILRRDHAHKKLLVVVDDVSGRQLTLLQLRSIWPTIDTAADGMEAVERVREKRYDLILMDLKMPVMDGLEATQRIRELPNGAAVPIVAFSANAFEEDREECLAAGMDDLVAKISSAGPLLEALLKWLRGAAADR